MSENNSREELFGTGAGNGIANVMTRIDDNVDSMPKCVTLREGIYYYIRSDQRRFKGSWSLYCRMMDYYLREWKDTPLVEITEDQVLEKFVSLEAKYTPSVARKVMRTLSAVYTLVAGFPGSSVSTNPVAAAEKRFSLKLKKELDCIAREDFLKFFQGLLAEPNEDIGDYILLLLFTGVRRSSATHLEWADIDFDRNTIRLLDVKRGQKYLVPMSTYLGEMLKQRRERCRDEMGFVFCRSDYDFRRGFARVAARANVKCTAYDLRRLYASVMSDLPISDWCRRKLLNQLAVGDDCHDSNGMQRVEALRGPVEAISGKMLEMAGYYFVDG